MRTERGRATPSNDETVAGSFRDPAGFVFRRDGTVFRQVDKSYGTVYDRLMTSGLYQSLVRDGLLLPHDEVPSGAEHSYAHKILRPVQLPFISYPYEWSFSQLRDAALLTLEIQFRAMQYGMSLKDASAYNIQLHRGRLVLIDTLSFELYDEDFPWVPYRQFCQHFLAPLALMAYKDVRLGQLLLSHIDGLPIGLATRLLPLTTGFKPGLLMHLHLHARSQRKHERKALKREAFRGRFSRGKLLALLTSLRSATEKIRWEARESPWVDYQQMDSYDEVAITNKKRLVAEFLDVLEPTKVWDLGANVGAFSRIAAARNIPVVSIDSDPAAVDLNYRRVQSNEERYVYPVLSDLTNPSPGGGWENLERLPLLQRGPTDTVLALALVHHMAISNNVPLDRLAGFLARLGRSLIIEFVPPGDAKVKTLLSMRDHDFHGYTAKSFEAIFAEKFAIEKRSQIENSKRVLYLMVKR